MTNEVNIKANNFNSPIKCGTALRINKANPELKAFVEEESEKTYIITGHKNGQVIIWENLSYSMELPSYKIEILKIVNY